MSKKIALVTGAASGMGRIYAQTLAAKGFHVAIMDLNEAGLAETATAEGDYSAYSCDIADTESVLQQLAAIESELGPVEYMVHCAALMPAVSVMNETPAQVDRLTRINYIGTINLIEAALKPMVKRDQGTCVFFGSIAGEALVPNMANYCATKAAVNAYVESVTQELKIAGSSVQVTLVKPPAVNTPLVDQTLETETPGSIKSAKETGRLADPADIVAQIERKVAQGKNIVYPGSARMLRFWHFFFPGLWWKTVGSFEKNK